MNGGDGVDPDVKIYLEDMKREIQCSVLTAVHAAIAEGFKEIKNVITELFKKDIGYLEKQQETFREQHKEHFLEHKQSIREITGMRESIQKDVDERLKPLQEEVKHLETRQTIDETATGVKEQVKTDWKNTSIAIWGIVIAVAGGLGAFIMWLID